MTRLFVSVLLVGFLAPFGHIGRGRRGYGPSRRARRIRYRLARPYRKLAERWLRLGPV